jgi:hypothetical protein
MDSASHPGKSIHQNRKIYFEEQYFTQKKNFWFMADSQPEDQPGKTMHSTDA